MARVALTTLARRFGLVATTAPRDRPAPSGALIRRLAKRSSPSLTLQVGKDPRPVMRTAYEAFSGRADPKDMLRAGGSDEDSGAFFYATLYYGLWYVHWLW